MSSTRTGALHPGLGRGGGRDVGHPGSIPASAGGLTALVDTKVGPKVGRAARQSQGIDRNGPQETGDADADLYTAIHIGFENLSERTSLRHILARKLLELDCGNLPQTQ